MQIIRNKLITYRWWRDGAIKPEHIEALEEHAEERIRQMMDEGYNSGELNDVFMTYDDPEEVIEYDGWWEVNE